jgi:predicted RNase H-like HicB family nuclease
VKYTVVYERTARNYSAYVPDLPGCVAAAKTKAETRRLIQEAIKLHLEAMREAGQPIPEPGTSTELIEV